MNCSSDLKIFPSASNFTRTILHRTKMKIHYDISMDKVIREKSRGEGSLIGQDTIENVSEPKFFF